jgi:heme-degrading monooxygenase HmoA
MYVIVWRYRVRAELRAAFERTYGPEGPWAELFARAPGYAGTELVRGDEPGVYLTLDRWARAADHARFERDWSDAYGALDAELEPLTDDEERIAAGEIVSVPSL